MAYDTIQSHKKAGFHCFSRKHTLGKNHRGGQIDHLPAFLGLTITEAELEKALLIKKLCTCRGKQCLWEGGSVVKNIELLSLINSFIKCECL